MKKIISLLSLVFLAGSAVFAQTADNQAEPAAISDKERNDVIKLSIDEAVEYALKNSRTLKSNDIDLELKKRAASNAWNVFLPNVQATGTMSRANEYKPGTGDMLQAALAPITHIPYEMPTDYEKEEDRWSTVGGVSASWVFTPAYIAQIKIAKVNYEAGKISWEQSQKETILSIKKLYYGLVLQQENLKIQRATLENARQRYIQAQTNFKNGLVPEIMLLQTQVNYETTKPNVESAMQGFYQNLDTLAFLLGYPVGTNLELTSSIEPVYVDVETQELLNRYAKNDLQIRNMEENIEAAKWGIKALDLSTWIPALSVNYAWQPVYVGSDGAWHFTGDIGKDDKWFDNGSLSLTLAWNLTNMLPWSANRQKVKDTKQQLHQAELALETLKENQKVKVRKAVDTLNLAKAQIDSMAKTVQVAQRAYEMQARSYRNGTTELLDLRDTESNLNSSKLGLLNQKMNYINALLDLENTLNTTLTSKESPLNAK